MSSTQSISSSESLTGSDPEPPRRRSSLHSSALPRRTTSTIRRRDHPRTPSAAYEEWEQPPLTTRRLSQVPMQDREQTVSEFLREESRPQVPAGSDLSAEARRQTIMAMDRKRRLTNSGHDGGRRRTTKGGFHERHSSGHSPRFDGPSSPRRREWYERSESRDSPSQVIDLTGSSPIAAPAPLPSMPPSRPLQFQTRRDSQVQSRGSSSSLRPYAVPRWQNDAEAPECPICGRSFGFLFRRHHCRKCGRVVCSECSPHRITLPRSLVVNPPGLDTSASPIRTTRPVSGRVETVDLTGDDDNTSQEPTNRSELEGAEKVRLCNPCVPDPQPEPQDDYPLSMPPLPNLSRLDPGASDFLSRRTGMSFPDFGRTSGRHEGEHSQQTRDSPSDDPYGHSQNLEYDAHRRAMHPGFPAPSLSREDQRAPQHYNSPNASSSSLEDRFLHIRRLMNGGMGPPPYFMQSFRGPPPPPNHARFQSLDSGSRPDQYANRPRVRSMLDVNTNMQRMLDPTVGHSAPSQAPHRPRYRESDMCPICRQLLPPRGADGDETAREAHIIECISARDPTIARSPAARQHLIENPLPPAPIQMISFVATEKDCLGEDGNAQECSICMVEYDVGDQLTRLECLCKFHKECIVAWFSRKPECPLHKIT